MRSEIRTTLAVLATAAVLLGSATMAVAADSDAGVPDPAATTTSPSPSASSPSPSATTASPTATTPTPTVTTPDPSASTPTPTPTETTPPVPTGAFSVTDAQMRWGINDESNNNSFAPGRVNFFSAGKIPDLGAAGTLARTQWKQADGNVTIEKYLNGAWTPATWDGLKTTRTGATMSGTNGPFSEHEVVISGGTGSVDAAKGSATIQWTGSFSVVYYSGYSFFYVTDPKLTVDAGIGTLTGTLSGFRSSMDDMTTWEPVAPVPGVVLANLGAVDLTADLGFTATPAYQGVKTPAGVTQNPASAHPGAFPESFVAYQVASGTGSYWYSSGGTADAHKVALPVTISYAAGAPVKVVPKPGKTVKAPAVDNDAPDAPDATPLAAPGVSPQLPAQSVPVVPVTADALQAGSTLTQFRPASTITGIRPTSDSSDATGIWILGGILLAAAVLIAASPFACSAVRKAD
ncbi:MAG: hypothetical protein ABWX74_16935 [Aeromicrobium sp.]